MPTHADRFLLALLISLSSAQPLLAAQESFPFLAEANESSVNVRAGQNKNFERLCQLDKGEEVIVLDKEFSWYKIQLPPKASVYVSEKYLLKRRSNQGQITADRVNLRAGPDINFSIIGQALEGQLVSVRDFKDGWYSIEPLKDTVGWVSEQFLSFKSKTVPIMQQAKVEALPTPEPILPEPEKVMAKAEIPTEEAITVTGVLTAQKNSQSEDVFYKIEDGGRFYFIKGLNFSLDNFLGYKVRAEGALLQPPPANTGSPLLKVSKIELIL